MKQGALAWANASQKESGFHRTGTNRLVAHSVQDRTLLVKYLPAVRGFLTWLMKRPQRPQRSDELDPFLADYLEEMCYKDERPFHAGSEAFFGFLCVFPEFKDRLPLSYRAYQSWKRLHVTHEGSPIPQETVFLVADWMKQKGYTEEALLTETSMDVYWRAGEWEQVCNKDVIDDGTTVAFLLGDADRGLRTKTGRFQGVILDGIALTAEWRIKQKGKMNNTLYMDEKVFSFNMAHFKKIWKLAQNALGIDCGCTHSLRHAGAARDVEMATRSLEAVRRRGRWRAADSVARYTKTWLLVAARSQTPPDLLEKGVKLCAARGKRNIRE